MESFISEAIEKTNITMLLVYAALWVGLLWFLVSLVRVMRSKNWPKVLGEVTKSEVVRRTRIGKSGQKTYQYDLDFEYKYQVNGVYYQGKRLRFYHVYGNAKNFFKQMSDQYPVNGSLNVFYNTHEPQQSVIQPGASSGIAMIVIFFTVSIGSMSAVFYDKLF